MSAQASPIAPPLISRHLVRLLGGAQVDPLLQRAIESLFIHLDAGHQCIPISLLDPASPADALEQQLLRFDCVGTNEAATPLILQNGYLYLQRYHGYEAAVANKLLALARESTRVADEERALQIAARLATDPKNNKPQHDAIAASATRRLCVISGGPGTGKTTTVAKSIALQLQLRDTPPLIALTAPTGKAAARLKEATLNGLRSLVLNGLFDSGDTNLEDLFASSTVHRLLGAKGDSVFFRHNRGNPLPHDIVVVDEVSMMDLPLMAKLLEAIDPAHTQLILLGDAEQLPSVQAGNVLADIIEGSTSSPLLGPCCHRLTRNYRAAENPALTQLIETIRTGNVDEVTRQLRSDSASLLWEDTPAIEDLEAALRPIILEHFRAFRDIEDPARALKQLERFRLLCALRRGPYGSESINTLATSILQGDGVVDRARHYHGMPIIITQNDYATRLFNGDVGIILHDATTGRLEAWFDAEDAPRSILPARLPAHEPAYALTVHKSQGSEFRDVLILLPNEDNALVTRELVYTAISRARNGVELLASEEVLKIALQRRVERASGLTKRLVTSEAAR